MKLITVPVVENFTTNRVIGSMTIDADSLPADPNFCFTLAFTINGVKREDIGKIPTKQHKGAYELKQIGIVSDGAYAGYLAQVGVVAK